MLNSVLTEQECNVLHNLVPLKSKINVGVVAKLYKAQNLAWISYGVGVCCGEKDHGRKSYFLRFYNLKSKSLAFEQEIFKEMEYTPSMSLFHIFQGSSCPYAISFVDQTSANNIENFINKTIEYSIVKSGKCLEKQTSVNKTNHSNVIATNGSTKSKKNSKAKLTAADIGIPMNFRHIEHVDLDPKKNMYNMSSPETQQLIGVLGQMGMGDVIHNDKEACLAMKFINKYGGLRALQSEGKNAISGPIQIQSKGPPPSRPPAFNPPNANINNNGNTLRSSRKLIPPPPVPSLRPPPPPPMVPPPSSGSTKNIPPPPPPPPPPVASGMAKSETPQPPKIPLPPIPTDGKPIKAVAPNPPSVEKKSSEFNLPVAPPSLQQQIINFSKERLKKTSSTTTDEKKETPKETQTGDSGLNTGLAMALVDALNRRRNMMDEEENSRSSSSENEWEEVH